MTYLTGEKVDGASQDNCTAPSDQNIYRYFFVRGDDRDPACTVDVDGRKNTSNDKVCGQCMRTTSWLSVAQSPAFVIDDYDFSNATYGAWTESVWTSLSGRIFLKADPALESGYLVCGVSVLVLSTFLVLWMEKFADDIFPFSVAPSEAAQGPPEAAREVNSSLSGNGDVVTSADVNRGVGESARL